MYSLKVGGSLFGFRKNFGFADTIRDVVASAASAAKVGKDGEAILIEWLRSEEGREVIALAGFDSNPFVHGRLCEVMRKSAATSTPVLRRDILKAAKRLCSEDDALRQNMARFVA